MKPKHTRLYLLIGTLTLLTVATILVLNAAKDGVMYYKTPSELTAYINSPKFNAAQSLRLGGLVTHYKRTELRHVFNVVDQTATIPAVFTGIAPALFAEGQGVVIDGHYRNGIFQAARVLAKHDENYKPPK